MHLEGIPRNDYRYMCLSLKTNRFKHPYRF